MFISGIFLNKAFSVSKRSLLRASIVKIIILHPNVYVVVQSPSHVWLFVTPWITAHQATLSLTFSWSCPSSCPLNQWCHPPIFIDRFKRWKREFRSDLVWPAFLGQWAAHQFHKRDSVCCFCLLFECEICSSAEVRMGWVRIWQPWWGILSIDINQISKIL